MGRQQLQRGLVQSPVVFRHGHELHVHFSAQVFLRVGIEQHVERSEG